MADCKRKTANLFDKDNTTLYNLFPGMENTIRVSSNARSIAIPCTGGETYTVSKKAGQRFMVCFTTDPIATQVTYTDLTVDNTATSITVVAPLESKYLFVYFYNATADVDTVETLINSIMINLGPTPFPYEPYGWVHSLRKLGTDTDTITTLPAVLYPTGTTATVGLKGQTVQSSTPSPASPVTPQGCGERTGNLFDKNAPDRTSTGYIKSDGSIQSSTNFSTSGYISINGLTTITLSGYNGGNEPAYCLYDSNKEYISGSAYTGRTTITVTVGTAAFIRISYRNTAADTTMVNTGSTALPYEPYGIKIPISLNSTTTNIYIGDEPLRKSLDGTAVDELAADGTLTRRVDSDGSVLATPVVTQITMPTFSTTDGANTVSVDTTVQPSEMTMTYHGWHTGTVHERESGQWD